MKKRYVLLVTEEQDTLLRTRAGEAGFVRKSDYIRFVLFMSLDFIEKINRIYERICGKDGS